MVDRDPESPSAELDAALPGTRAPRIAAIENAPAQASIGRVFLFASIAGILAGVASSVVGEVIVDRNKLDLTAPVGVRVAPEDLRRWHDAELRVAVATFSVMGALMGLAMGAAGTLARGSYVRAAGSSIMGLLLGTIVAVPVSFGLVSSFYKRYDPHAGDLLFPMLTHGVIWSASGGVAGLVLGLGLGGRGRWKPTLVGGLVGAAAATVIYEIAGAVVFPTSRTDMPLATSTMARVLPRLLVAILSAVGAAVALQQTPAKEASSY